MPTLTREILEAAIYGFEQQKIKIDNQIAELRAMLPASSATVSPRTQTKEPKRNMSAAGREAIAKARRKRWAAKKPKRKLSAAGRANIVAALKKRWAEKKSAAGKSVQKKAAKKDSPKAA